jgi:hypothetical protein
MVLAPPRGLGHANRSKFQNSLDGRLGQAEVVAILRL